MGANFLNTTEFPTDINDIINDSINTEYIDN